MRPGLCIATMLAAGVLQAQVFRAPATGLPDTILTLSAANDLLVRAVLNGQDPLTLMFHSGVEGLSLTEVGQEKAPSFRTPAPWTWAAGAARRRWTPRATRP